MNKRLTATLTIVASTLFGNFVNPAVAPAHRDGNQRLFSRAAEILDLSHHYRITNFSALART
jgi:hypothetical protein